MKFKCLILDHDDTVVASSEAIHYPSFIEYLKDYKPELKDNYTFESFIIKNFDPGIVALLRDEVGLTEAEMQHEEEYWARFVESCTPKAYPGMKRIMERFIREGGVVIVASHSLTRYIERDYRENTLPTPHAIYGWDIPKEKRKPSPYTVLDVMEKYGFKREEILVVDDLKPGYDMARAAGVAFAAAGWAYDVPEIEKFMRNNCDYYFKKTEELERLVFEE